MTKSKTILAGLGVVAALGAAALPLASYATESVSGNVELQVEVLPAIAMTISGNNDTPDHTFYTAASVSTGDDVTGLYEKSGSAYAVTSDTTAQDGKTYYTHADYGVAKSAAPNGATTLDGQNLTTNNYTIGNSTSMAAKTSSSYTSILPNNKVDGNSTNGFGSTVTVYTNNSAGYTLSIKDADATLALENENGDTIAAGTTISAGTSNWAYQLQKSDNANVETPAYAAITAADVTIVTRETETSNGSQSFIGYGVSTSGDQATGLYADTIVYTATTR